MLLKRISSYLNGIRTKVSPLLFIMFITGCSLGLPIPNTDFSNKIKLSIEVTEKTFDKNSNLTSNKTIIPTQPIINDYILKGSLNGGTLNTITTFDVDLTTESGVISVESGTWHFILSARDSAGVEFLSGELDKTISVPENLAFVLKPIVIGTGSFNLTIKLPAGHGAKSVNTLLDGTAETSILSVNEVIFTKSFITAKDYFVNFKLLDINGKLLVSVSEIIAVYSGVNTVGVINLNLSDFNSPPIAPDNLSASIIDNNLINCKIKLNWDDKSNNESGFIVTVDNTTDYSVVAASSEYIFTSVRGNTYSFKVKAVNDFGESIYTLQKTIEVPYFVEFESNEGTPITSIEVLKGSKITEPSPAPIKLDYTFLAWYKDIGLLTPWNFVTDAVISNVKIYAKWQLAVSSNNNLAALTTSQGPIAGFLPATLNYTLNVTSLIAGITVTPTAEDSFSTIEVNVNGGAFSSVTSGDASANLTLNPGVNTIEIKVKAQDTSIKIYKLTVNKTVKVTIMAGDSNGSVSPALSNDERMPGEVIPITATPLTDCFFKDWNGSSLSNWVTPNTTLTVPPNDVVITANFIKPTFAVGDGTVATPYQVTTVEELNYVRYFPNKEFTQMNAIDLNVSPYNTDPGWLPIGNSSTPFTGKYYGNGNPILNMMINRPATNDNGLFGYVQNATLQDIVIVKVNINSFGNTGGLSGNAYTSTVERCFVLDGSITSVGNNTGGLLGYMSGGTVNTSYTQKINISSNGWSVGGLIGYAANSFTVQNCYSTSNVNSNESSSGKVGGLIGAVNNIGTIINTYSAGSVKGIGPDKGGLIGFGTITPTNSFYDTDFSGMIDNTKGGPLTTLQMTLPSNFTDWAISSTTWKQDGEVSYPYLDWQGTVNIPRPVKPIIVKWDFQSSTPLANSLIYPNTLTQTGGTFGLVDGKDAYTTSTVSDSLVSVESPSINFSGNGQTISFWLYGKPTLVGNIISKYRTPYSGTADRIWSIGAALTNRLNVLDNPGYVGGTVSNYEFDLNDGAWNHIVVVFDLKNSKAFVYINNVLKGAPIMYTAAVDFFVNTPSKIYIGNSPNTTASGKALMPLNIAKVRIFNYPLDVTEVNSLFIE